MSDKTIVLITGGNTGLGYEAVKAFYSSSNAYEILLGTRKIENGEQAVEKLKQEIKQSSSSVSIVQADVTSDESLDTLVKGIEEKYGKLDALISTWPLFIFERSLELTRLPDNAGAGFDGQIQSGKLSIRDAFNASWDTNVSGAHVLTTLAMSLLFKSKDPRLLFVTSGTSSLVETEIFEGHLARLNAAPDAGWPKSSQLNPVTSYRSTKTGLNMLMREWDRILRNDPVKVFSISPGFLATGLGGVGTEMLKKVSRLFYSPGACAITDYR